MSINYSSFRNTTIMYKLAEISREILKKKNKERGKRVKGKELKNPNGFSHEVVVITLTF